MINKLWFVCAKTSGNLQDHCENGKSIKTFAQMSDTLALRNTFVYQKCCIKLKNATKLHGGPCALPAPCASSTAALEYMRNRVLRLATFQVTSILVPVMQVSMHKEETGTVNCSIPYSYSAYHMGFQWLGFCFGKRLHWIRLSDIRTWHWGSVLSCAAFYAFSPRAAFKNVLTNLHLFVPPNKNKWNLMLLACSRNQFLS